jgi:glycosyltransferase involved in cell wall biosynthesis
MAIPFISVLIDTYNHEDFVEHAIESVLEQDFGGDREIVIVDDGSTDRTPEILRKFEPSVRILRKANGGQASAFNVGIPECRGEIIAFLDADDWWTRNKLARVVEAMARDPELGIVGNGIVNVQPDGRELVETLKEGFRFQANSLEGAAVFRRRCSFLGTSRMTIRRELLGRIGPVPEEIVIQADEYLFTLAAVLTPVEILPEPLTYYRLHSSNNFLISGRDVGRLRRKQVSLAALHHTVTQRLESLRIDPKVQEQIIAYTRQSAIQMRLQLDGGWPWETVRTEWNLYRLQHPEAGSAHRLFKRAILAGALFVDPRVFYRIQRGLAQNAFYRKARARWLPVPEARHVNRESR